MSFAQFSIRVFIFSLLIGNISLYIKKINSLSFCFLYGMYLYPIDNFHLCFIISVQTWVMTIVRLLYWWAEAS